jgi:hypothetical protein
MLTGTRAGGRGVAAALTLAGRTEVRAGAREERTLTLLALASRAGYCLYAAAVVVLNIADYQRPGLVAGALILALLSSAWLGAQVWRSQTVPGRVALLDTGVAALVLLLVAAAIRSPGQPGSLNWALAYAVACAMWLALGHGLRWRAWLAVLLGAVYGVSVLALASGADTALVITAVVNAASPPMYFGIAAAITWVVHRIAAEMAAEHAVEQRQQRDLAALAERERLVGQVHRSVLATLDLVASGQAPWHELRGRARAEVIALRGAFREPDVRGPDVRGDLRSALTTLAGDRASAGWRIELIDEELDAEPPPAVTRAMRDALAELIAGPAPGDGLARVQIRASEAGAEVLARVPTPEPAVTAAITRAQDRLAPVAGTATPEPALPGEVRVRLRVPA